MMLNKDVAVDLLKKKELSLLAGYSIVCYENIASYVKATATAGYNIEVIPLNSHE